MKTLLRGLYAITDSTLMPNDEILLNSVEQALKGGTAIVQYRDKSTDQSKRLRQAKALNALCQRYNTALIINDDIELAKASGAAGVHLGQNDGQHQLARQALGSDAIIGITCHDDIQLAHNAVKHDADYVAFGAFFPSKTKPNAKPAPLSLLTDVKQQIALPIVAIGGISMDNAHQVIDAGADMIAVVHALFAAEQIDTQARHFSQLF